LKVTIVNGYHDSNKGSCAIAWGLIRRLERTGLVDSISLVSMLREDSPLFSSGFRHLRENFPEVNFLGSPVIGLADYLDRHKTTRGHSFRQWLWAVSFLRQYLVMNHSSPGRMAAHNPALRAILDSDLVVERGGPFFAAGRSPVNPSLYFYALPLLYARRGGIPFGFAPESIGPLANRFARNFVGDLFRDACFISVRENISRATLVKCGVKESSIQTMLDSAFWVKPRHSTRLSSVLSRHGLDRGSFISIVCRQWLEVDQRRYHRELAAVIDRLVPKIFPRAALVLNAYGPLGGPDDSRATRQLFEYIQKKEYVSLVEEDLAPDELAALYGQADLLLGTRLHSVILSLTGGTPVVAVSYGGPKTRGIMQLLGLDRYVVDINTVDRETIIALMRTAKQEQEPVIKQIPLYRERDDRIFFSLLENSRKRERLDVQKSKF